MFKAIKRLFGKKKREIERKKEIEHLKKIRNDKIEDAAYWFTQNDHKEYLKSIMEAVDINDKILILRRKAI